LANFSAADRNIDLFSAIAAHFQCSHLSVQPRSFWPLGFEGVVDSRQLVVSPFVSAFHRSSSAARLSAQRRLR
jgi:hypothetical protein